MVRPRLGPAIAALCRALNRRAKSLDAPGGGDRPRARQTPHLTPQTSWHLDDRFVVSVEQADGANSWRVFLPPRS